MRESDPKSQQAPGTGVDRSQIQELLAVTAAERVRKLAIEAKNMAAFTAKLRRM